MSRSTVEQIKARLSIDEVISSYVKIEKAGKTFKAKCPFHNEKTPSFFISPDRGGYYCFGCGAKGDIFTFVEQFEGLDFRGALKILADRAGVELVFDQKSDGERDILFAIMEEATKFYEQQFSKSNIAQSYIKSRGITDDTRKAFRIGWAPEGWRNIHSHLRSKNFPERLIEKAGLIKQKDASDSTNYSDQSNGHTDTSKGYYDRFRGRIMFPIADSSGRVVAFSGRILNDDGKSAKYLNSPDTPLYDKSMILYGLDKAKSEIRIKNYSILVEGQMDLVLSHQAGVKNTVAASGTALTDETINSSGIISNLGLVKRLSSNVIIAFDSDNAGRKAALRGAGIALSIGMDVKVASLPDGKDPADIVRENVDSWKQALRDSKHVIEFELDNCLRDNTDSRKIAKSLRERVFPFLARIGSAMDQAHFVRLISDRTKINEDAIWQDFRVVENQMKSGADPVTRNNQPNNSINFEDNKKTINKTTNKIDLIERRILGLLHNMKKSNMPNVDEYYSIFKNIVGENFTEIIQRAEPMIEDFAFEAEALFGSDASRIDVHMRELLFNFEQDVISRELMFTMSELKIAEKNKDIEEMSKLVSKCQQLSMKKADLAKRKK